MNITYTHGQKQWRFAVTANDPDADLDVSSLTQTPDTQTGHAQKVAARALRDYLALSATERIYNAQKRHPLAHMLARAVWACMPMRCVGKIPVTAVIVVGGEAAWQGFIAPQVDLFVERGADKKVEFARATRVVEWQLLLARDENWRVRYALAQHSQHEAVHMILARDENWRVRYALAQHSQHEAVHMILARDENVDVRYVLAWYSRHEAVHMILARDEDWEVRRALAQHSRHEAVHMILARDADVRVRYALARHSQQAENAAKPITSLY